MIKELKVWEVLVPAMMNGRKVKIAHHKKWDKYITCLTGGLTLVNKVRGKWLYNSRLCDENMICVRIACTEQELQTILRITLQHYKQDAIFANLISEKAVIYEKEQQDTPD